MSPTEFSIKRCGERSRCVLHEACFFDNQVSVDVVDYRAGM
jgi:hypothetical protein